MGKKKIKRKGFISAYVLMVSGIAVTLLTGLVVFVSSSQRLSTNEASSQQALEIAESGIYFYRWYLAHTLDGKNAQQIKDFWQSGAPLGVDSNYESEMKDFEGNGFGRYQVSVTAPESDSTIVEVVSTGWTYRQPNVQRSVRVRFRRPSWSEYSVLANDDMRFGEGTNTYGPVHSNHGIRFDGVANNLVTSAVSKYDDPDHSGAQEFGVHTHVSPTDPLPPNAVPDRQDVFLAGRSFPEPAIDFNSVTADLAYMKQEAQSGGLYLAEEFYTKTTCKLRWGKHWCGVWAWCQVCNDEQFPVMGYNIILRTDDKVEIRRVFDYQGDNALENPTYKITDESESEIVDIPSNGLIYVDNYTWVEGQINTAHVTIVAAKSATDADADIYINNNILYTNKDGSDTIGLIAENDISIGLYSANELEIDAALLSQKGRVGRDYYYDNIHQFHNRNEITIYGSIATNKRYGFAWTDGTGYQIKNIYFDNNLTYYPPPYFPTGTQYEFDLWEDL